MRKYFHLIFFFFSYCKLSCHELDVTQFHNYLVFPHCSFLHAKGEFALLIIMHNIPKGKKLKRVGSFTPSGQ